MVFWLLYCAILSSMRWFRRCILLSSRVSSAHCCRALSALLVSITPVCKMVSRRKGRPSNMFMASFSTSSPCVGYTNVARNVPFFTASMPSPGVGKASTPTIFTPLMPSFCVAWCAPMPIRSHCANTKSASPTALNMRVASVSAFCANQSAWALATTFICG